MVLHEVEAGLYLLNEMLESGVEFILEGFGGFYEAAEHPERKFEFLLGKIFVADDVQ